MTMPSPSTSNHLMYLKLFLAVAVLLNGTLWLSVRYTKPQWNNVPPVPSETSSVFSTLGDRQFSYRVLALAIQNFGDTGGRVINLAEYNYETLAGWMTRAHDLDPHSNAVPAIAAYFYGANRDHEKLGPIIDYLERAGSVKSSGQGVEKWRWLAHAVFLARHKLKDYDRALDLAHKLAAIDQPDMPAWTKQMPAFVMNARGEKEDALALMLQLIKTESDTMHPNEINAIKAYICEQIFTAEEAAEYELCQGDF